MLLTATEQYYPTEYYDINNGEIINSRLIWYLEKSKHYSKNKASFVAQGLK